MKKYFENKRSENVIPLFNKKYFNLNNKISKRIKPIRNILNNSSLLINNNIKASFQLKSKLIKNSEKEKIEQYNKNEYGQSPKYLLKKRFPLKYLCLSKSNSQTFIKNSPKKVSLCKTSLINSVKNLQFS